MQTWDVKTSELLSMRSALWTVFKVALTTDEENYHYNHIYSTIPILTFKIFCGYEWVTGLNTGGDGGLGPCSYANLCNRAQRIRSQNAVNFECLYKNKCIHFHVPKRQKREVWLKPLLLEPTYCMNLQVNVIFEIKRVINKKWLWRCCVFLSVPLHPPANMSQFRFFVRAWWIWMDFSGRQGTWRCISCPIT